MKGAALAASWSIPNRTIIAKWGQLVAARPPLAGDVALYRWGGNRICHVEVIVSWPDDEDFFWVIGGNTSNPNKPSEEGVFAKRRLKRECLVVNRIDNYN